MTEAAIRGTKGLASVKDLPIRQDGPPPGGFPAVRYARSIPNTGPSGVALVLGATAVIAFGFYQIGQGNLKRRAYKKEKLDARIAVLPLIQAEEDMRFVEQMKKNLEEEARVMASVPGWKVGENVYHSRRWMPPSNGKFTIF